MTLHFRVFLSKDSSEIFYQKTAGLFAKPWSRMLQGNFIFGGEDDG